MEGFTAVDPPRGMLEYAIAGEPFYVTFKGAGRSKGSDAPVKVYSCYQRERKVSVVGFGAIRVERITAHYKAV